MLSARLTIDPRFPIGTVDRRLFGSFVEHLGRCVYDRIYEPGHPRADDDGFRQDVLHLVRELGVTTVRYPGGNFVSGFRWEDSVGPRENRPRRRDLAWHSTETNEFGLHEFARWLGKADAELMLAVNLGTRGTLEALDLLEYCNVRSGTALSDLCVTHGAAEPFAVRMWCLGNEMDGPWQLGHRTAEDYGKLAARTAKALRQLDPHLELIVCGSAHSGMPTFGAWERTVLEHTYEDVELISCHTYYQDRDGDLASFLASAVDMDRFTEAVVAAADHVKTLKRSDRQINLSFDEWNVWHSERRQAEDQNTDDWPVAPRLLENIYSVADAVVVSSLLTSLLRHADRVKAASLAQLVNVIAPIMTEPGGPAWRQTTFYPFALAARLAQGTSLRVGMDCDTHTTAKYGDVSALDVAATFDEATGRAAIFLANRNPSEPVQIRVDTRALGERVGIIEASQLTDADRYASNTLEQPDRVRPTDSTTTEINAGVLTATLPAVSWTAIALG